VTDLRDQLDAFEAAAARLHVTPAAAQPAILTDRRNIAHTLWRLRGDTGMSLDGLANRLGLSRSGICKREHDGRIPASALVDHARALGYALALVPLTADRRTAL
jgi:hypothetical protein